MIVNAQKETGGYEKVEIPSGSWGVILQVQTELVDPFEYQYRSGDTNINFVGPEPKQLVLKRWRQKDFMYERTLFWSPTPFAVIESWEMPLDGTWIHLAKEIGDQGLTNKMPVLGDMPICSFSNAGWAGREERRAKWARLSELAEALGVTPRTILDRHARHFDGYGPQGVHYIELPPRGYVTELAQTEKHSVAWTIPEMDALYAADPSRVWVRAQFALVAKYLHMLGYKSSEELRVETRPK